MGVLLFSISLASALSINTPETLTVYAGDNFTIQIEGEGIFELNITGPCYSETQYGTSPMEVLVYVSDDAPSNNQTCIMSASYSVTNIVAPSGSSGGGGTTIKYIDSGYGLPAPDEEIEEEEIEDEEIEEEEIEDEEVDVVDEIEEEIVEPIIKEEYNNLVIIIVISLLVIGFGIWMYFVIKKEG